MATFTWKPSYQCAVTIAPRLRAAIFGDGYQQRVEDGINTQIKAWDVSFTVRTDSEAAAIMNFLKDQAADSFDWTDPDGEALKWICKSRRKQIDGYGINVVTARFEQVAGE